MQPLVNTPQLGDQLEVKIDKLSHGGAGIGRHSGWVIFVPYSVPGDHLLVEVSAVEKNLLRGKISKILVASDLRRDPLCPVFGRCGGCQWQHIVYQAQLKNKQAILDEQLTGLIENAQKLPPVASPKEFHYRNRIQVRLDEGRVGYYRESSHDFVPIEKCPIADDQINKKILQLTIPVANSTKKKLEEKIEIYLTSSHVAEVRPIEEFSSDLFSQVNEHINKILIENLISWVKPVQAKIFYDFYSGSGNFMFPILQARRDLEFVCVEQSLPLARKANEVLRSKNISSKKVRFYGGDVGEYLRTSPLEENSIIFLDPPRTGCKPEVINFLAMQNFSRLFYLSCNPSTLKRDLASLFTANPRLKLVKYQLFDMFPQTFHSEVLVEVSVDSLP